MAATNSPLTNNAAMAGCLGGMSSGRQPVTDAAGTLMQPSDFSPQVSTAVTLAEEEQVALGASFAGDGGAPAYFTNTGNGGVTVTGSTATAAEANALQTLPVAMMLLAMASFDLQGNPSNANGQIVESYFAAQANAISAVFANAVVQSGASGPILITT